MATEQQSVPLASVAAMATEQQSVEAAQVPKSLLIEVVITKMETESFGIQVAGGSEHQKRPYLYVSCRISLAITN